MKVVERRQDLLVSEGQHKAVIEGMVTKETRKGKLKFLVCRVNCPGPDHGRTVEYLLPRDVRVGASFHKFLVSMFGDLTVGQNVDPGHLVGKTCQVTVKHLARDGRVYANAVALAPCD